MSFKMKGFDEFERKLNKMQKSAEELEGTQEIPFEELFTDSFMQKHTSLSNLQELFDKSDFKVETTEDFAAIPDEPWDEYIRSVTEFDSWEEMLGTATEEYVVKKLGF